MTQLAMLKCCHEPLAAQCLHKGRNKYCTAYHSQISSKTVMTEVYCYNAALKNFSAELTSNYNRVALLQLLLILLSCEN